MDYQKKSISCWQTEQRLCLLAIGLAWDIDNLGFVKYSKIYKGNIGEPETFEIMLDDVASQLYLGKENPVVVMDEFPRKRI
jgi:hypothetical protein